MNRSLRRNVRHCFLISLALMVPAGTAMAHEVLICETEPASPLTGGPAITQETRYACPGIQEKQTLPQLYRLGWRLIQVAGNNRTDPLNPANPSNPGVSIVVILEKAD